MRTLLAILSLASAAPKEAPRFALLLLPLLWGCASAEIPDPPFRPPEFGDPVGPLAAKLEAVTAEAAEGSILQFRVTLKNVGSGRKTLTYPDMNDPEAWQVRLIPLDSVLPGHEEVGYGNCAAVGSPRNERPFRLSLEPFDQKAFTLFLRGEWDGWSKFGKETASGHLWASAWRFPPPGRYLAFASYAPQHADRPELEELPGWGVTTPSVEVRILARP